jgi:hypothetical protein
LEIIVPKHVIVSINHVITARVYVLLVAVNVDIQGQTVVKVSNLNTQIQLCMCLINCLLKNKLTYIKFQ